jgi:ataxia telangiectasia mutated family protein
VDDRRRDCRRSLAAALLFARPRRPSRVGQLDLVELGPGASHIARIGWVWADTRIALPLLQQDRSLATSKFALVPRLRQLVSQLPGDRLDEFAGNWVWQLKQSLPSPGDLPRHESQIDGYLEILQTAQMQAPSLEAIDQLPRARSLEWDRHRPTVEDAAKSQVILVLVDRLQSETVETIDIAYQVLQGVVVAAEHLISSSAFRAALVKLPDVREQLTLLGRPAARPHGLVVPPLSEIYQQVPVSSVQRPDGWLSRLASFLARVLVAQDGLFGHLGPLLDHSSAFAASTLPLLVQALVATEPAVDGPQMPKTILSTYFAAVLRTPAAGLPVKQAIIDVVLHLRRIEPRASDPKVPVDPLAHERWLDPEYLLLSRAAVECKAYTTGLLFLELQHQAAGEAARPSEEATQILFDIYANIEDPDGFYGVKSADWRSSLVQKLHHENRWAQAFGFHGADYRYAPSPTSVEGIYRSLHSFGFDRMALTLAQSSDAQHAGADVKDDLGYELAWRTETWDVPVSSSAAGPPTSNALLYAALRAVHNERSLALVRSTVSTAVQVELSKLRSLSIESMAEIRAAQATLVCLREIRRWLDLRVGGDDLSKEQWDDALPWVGDDHE